MNIGELFVNLGIKGGKDTQNTLKGVKGGMKDVKSISLEAKAAILATIYTLKSLMQQSTQNGVALAQFSNLTGLSTKKLQQWQYANKQAGGTAEEVTGVVTNMQQAFAQLELGEGPAKYMGLFADELSRIGESLDVTKMNDSFYTLEKFRKFIQAGGTGKVGIDNEIGTSLGITPGMIAGMRGGLFNDKILGSANVYSDSQSKSLQNVNAQWVQLSDNIQKTIGRLNVKFGATLIKNIGAIVKELAGLIEQMVLFSEQLGVFERIAEAIKNIANFAKIAKDNLRLVNEGPNKDEEGYNAMAINTRIKAGLASNGGKPLSFFDVIGQLIQSKYGYLLGDGSAAASTGGAYSQIAAPNVGSGFEKAPSTVVQQTINVGAGANVPAIKEAAKTGSIQGVQSAYRQLSAQGL